MFFDNFQNFRIQDPSKDIILNGGVYIFGRDQNFVPNLYILTEKLLDYQESMSSIHNAIVYLSIIIIENMLIQGVVERFNVIIKELPGESKEFFLLTLMSVLKEIFTELLPMRINRIFIQDSNPESIQTVLPQLEEITTPEILTSFDDPKYLNSIEEQ